MVYTGIHYRSGAQLRGEDTRRRILEAAIEIFAAEGYDGASTRLLAERAGVNLPAIQYYFGSKEGLYRAAIERIGQEIEEQMDPTRSRVLAALEQGKLDRATVLDLLADLISAFATLVLTSSGAAKSGRKQFIARAEIEAQPALDLLHDHMLRHVLRPCAALVGRLIGRPAEDEETVLRALTLVGQVTVFCNRPALRALGWSEFDPQRLQAVQRMLRGQIETQFAATAGAK